MKEKVYLGYAKKSNYGIRGSIDIAPIIKDLIAQGGNIKELAQAFDLIYKNCQNKKGYYTQIKDDKKIIKINIETGENRNTEFSDYYFKLNKWQAENKTTNNQGNKPSNNQVKKTVNTPTDNDDLPFDDKNDDLPF